MKTILFIILTALSLSFTTIETSVYFCNNGSTKVFHLTKECRGIKRCTHEVKEVSKSEAVEKYELRLCGYEN